MPDEPLDYSSLGRPSSPGRNRWWKVLLRIIVGCLAGVVACVMGMYLLAWTSSLVLASLPFCFLFSGGIYVSIALRRYGYTGGLILAPFLTVTALIILLWVACSNHPI